MEEQTGRPVPLRPFLGRAFAIVVAAFVLGLGIGFLMSGGEAADTNGQPTGLDLQVVPVTVSVQPLAPPILPAPALVPTPAPAGSPAPGPLAPATYTVQSGDSLSIIADRFGITVQALIAANQITQPNALEVGQVLVLPRP